MSATSAVHHCIGNPCTLCRPATACDVPLPYGYERAHCQCPSAWWGVVPPYCPVHNPGYTQVIIRTAPDTVPAFPVAPDPQPLAPGDIEQIAQRVAELLRGRP